MVTLTLPLPLRLTVVPLFKRRDDLFLLKSLDIYDTLRHVDTIDDFLSSETAFLVLFRRHVPDM
jgi:hypothetical protein